MSTRTRQRNIACALYFFVERRQIIKKPPYERENCNVERERGKKRDRGRKNPEKSLRRKRRDISRFILRWCIHTHGTHVAYYFVTNLSDVTSKLPWTTDAKGHSESLPWNMKEYAEVCVNESGREKKKKSEKGRGRTREWINVRYFYERENSDPPRMCILREESV